jgi:transposase-like protein
MAVAPGRGLRQPQAGVANIRGQRHYLWRAVDHEGEVLESYVTKKLDKAAALKFLKKAMKRYGNPRVVVTDRCPSYRAAMKVIGNERRQETGRHLNNRAENSHLPFWATRASHVLLSADGKFAEVRFNPFVST